MPGRKAKVAKEVLESLDTQLWKKSSAYEQYRSRALPLTPDLKRLPMTSFSTGKKAKKHKIVIKP